MFFGWSVSPGSTQRELSHSAEILIDHTGDVFKLLPDRDQPSLLVTYSYTCLSFLLSHGSFKFSSVDIFNGFTPPSIPITLPKPLLSECTIVWLISSLMLLCSTISSTVALKLWPHHRRGEACCHGKTPDLGFF